MSSIEEELCDLYQRDLSRLIENLEQTPNDILWQAPEGINNSCGILVQHLVGNLNYFIGKGLGDIDYIRKRDTEFANTQTSKEELIEDIRLLQDRLDTIFSDLDEQELDKEFPMEVSIDATTREFLIHLYGHLNYHLGQINYLRRML